MSHGKFRGVAKLCVIDVLRVTFLVATSSETVDAGHWSVPDSVARLARSCAELLARLS